MTRIADALQPGSRTLLTEIDIPNPDGALAPGIYCTVELHIPRKTPSFTVPADAIIFNADGVQVAVVENGVVHLRKVGCGARSRARRSRSTAGSKAGDQVILNPAVDLADGSKVRSRAAGGADAPEPRDPRPRRMHSKTLFNGATGSDGPILCACGSTALLPEAVFTGR